MEDTWGLDPQVRYMRRVFSRMERVQKDLLEAAGLQSYDKRVSRFRETALELFERVWPQAAKRGILRDEDGAASLYAHCFADTLLAEGITLPPDRLPSGEAIALFLKEVLR